MAVQKLKSLLHKIGAGQTFVVLSVLYFLVGAPVAFVLKLFGKDPLRSKPEDGSYWQERKQKKPTIETYLKQY